MVLPQGQFQEFLAGSADKRRAVLRDLLSVSVYERMRGRASSMASDLGGRVKGLEHELAALAEATPENLARLNDELVGRRMRSVTLADQVEVLARAVEQSQALTRARSVLEGARAEAKAAEDELSKTQALVSGGEAQAAKLESGLVALKARLAANCYDHERHTALTLGMDRARNLQKCLEDLAALQVQRDNAETTTRRLAAASEAAEKKQTASEAELDAAEQARRDAELHNLAAALQRGLKPGDPCPVCGGVVGEMPGVQANGIEAAQRREESARRAVAASRQALQAALAASTRATATVISSEERFETLRQQQVSLSNSLVEALPDEADITLPGLVAALNQQIEARRERVILETQVREAESGLQRLMSDLAAARQKHAALAQRSQSAVRELCAAEEAVKLARASLAALADTNGWQDVAATVSAGKDVGTGLKTRLAGAQAEHQQTLQAIGQSEARIARLTEDMERVKGLRKEHETLKKEHAVADDLAKMLGALKFQDFVQAEALQTLASDGSRRLEELSAGRYRLKVEDKGRDFEVIDQWNADQPRSVKTLSGGETFLASLSLALALAESLPKLAASRRIVLDSIFLDEGFGSLDIDALDLAAEALEALRMEGRTVCVVTHLPELAQRLPARVVVTKSALGSTVAVE